MASFYFPSFKVRFLNDEISLKSGAFYVHLVAAIPSESNTEVSNLILPTGGTYVPATLSPPPPRTAIQSGSQAQVNFNNPIWSQLTTVPLVNLYGQVICYQVGGAPAASDYLVAYFEFNPSNPATPGGIYQAQGADFMGSFTSILI